MLIKKSSGTSYNKVNAMNTNKRSSEQALSAPVYSISPMKSIHTLTGLYGLGLADRMENKHLNAIPS